VDFQDGLRGMVVPWVDKKEGYPFGRAKHARRVRGMDASNQNPAWKYAKVGKQIAAHDFCKWLL